jgi:conjugative relaxase-like TrwC/TraI family protein
VLRLSKVTPGGHAYYLEVAGGGAGTGVEAPGSWVGAGAASLGLSGHVLGPELEAVLAGRDPATDAALGRAHHRVRVAAFDLTFCAPKSVSLLHALGGPESRAAVAESHVAAVDAALAYMERHALAVRRSSAGGRTVEPAGGTAVAGFVHRTSRALDPHLHTHAVAANLACAPDGTWSALDSRGVYAHSPAAGAVYHAQLRYELTSRLGVAWEPLDRGRADVAGIGPEARRAFSVRSTQIAAHLAERGLGGHRAHELAAARTRAAKDPTRSVEDLAPWWR